MMKHAITIQDLQFFATGLEGYVFGSNLLLLPSLTLTSF